MAVSLWCSFISDLRTPAAQEFLFLGHAFPILMNTASETANHKVGAVEGSVSELTRQTDNDDHLR